MDDKSTIVHIPANTILFGQFLIERKKLSQDKLDMAIEIQKKEDSLNLRQSHRLLGVILLESLKIFKDRMELNQYLQEFNKFREIVEARIYQTNTQNKKEEKHT